MLDTAIAKMRAMCKSKQSLTCLNNFFDRLYYTPNGCLLSGNTPNAKGYIYITINRKKYRAHRIIYFLINDIPLNSNLQALHICNNRACIEPKHIYEGSAADNTEDMLSVARGANQYIRNFGRSAKHG